MITMSNENKLNIIKDRLQKLESNNKNVRSQGVVKKLRRQIRALENTLV